MSRLLLLGLLMCSLMTTPAHALLITINPDLYRPGTDVSNLFVGASLSTISHSLRSLDPPTYGPVYVVEGDYRGYPTSAGPNTVGTFTDAYAAASCWSTGSCSGSSNSDFRALLIQMDSPTNFLNVNGLWQSDPPAIFAFDANKQLVGSCHTFGTNCTGIASITHYNYDTGSNTLQVGNLEGHRVIQTIIIGGLATNVPVGVDTISYSVPEPSSFLLLLSGGMLLLFVRRIDTRDISGSADTAPAPVASR